MYENLKKAITDEYTKRREERKLYIINGYHPEWAEDQKQESDQGIKRYSTDTRWQAYKAGEITREKAAELAIKRGLKEINKDEAEDLQKLERVFNATELQYINISVEWTKSRTWGNIPHATVHTNYGVFTGTASGCGYDKESAAIAQALNQSTSVLKMLYDKKEQAADKNNHDALGYGSGYGILPAFEGGVGVSSHRQIFENCGYTWEQTGSGKTYDAYRVSRSGQ